VVTSRFGRKAVVISTTAELVEELN